MDKKYYVLIALFILMLIGMASSKKTKNEEEKAKSQAIAQVQKTQNQVSNTRNTVIVTNPSVPPSYNPYKAQYYN